MRTISFEVSESLAANICPGFLHFSLHSKGIVDEQIARFVGNFASNFMIFKQMIDKR